MKAIIKISALILLAIISIPISAHALGVGLYGSYQFGESSYESEGSNFFGDDYIKNWDMSNELIAIGFITDSATAKDQLFNYRFQLAAGWGTINWDYRRKSKNTGATEREDHTYNIIDVATYHSFGFGIIRRQSVRLWIGPQVGAGYCWDDINPKYGEFSFYFGAVIGININIGERLTLFVDGGARGSLSIASEPIIHSGYDVFVDAGFMFRIDDTYSTSEDREDLEVN